MEHLLQWSKYSIFHNIFSNIWYFKGVKRRFYGVQGVKAQALSSFFKQGKLLILDIYFLSNIIFLPGRNSKSNRYSCIKTYVHSCLKPLSNERKPMFKSWDSHAVWTWLLTWQYLKWALGCLHDVIPIGAAQTDHSAVAFVRKNDACHYDDVMTFKSLQLTPFCLEKSSVRKQIV